MIVDESGTESPTNGPDYFGVLGIIVHENDLDIMDKAVENFRNNLFPAKFRGCEIHTHDINSGTRDFAHITRSEQNSILSDLYAMVNSLPFQAISVVINKPLLKGYSHENILQIAYTMLVERFDIFLSDTNSKGLFIIDRITSKPNSLGKKDCMIFKLVSGLRRRGSNIRRIDNIVLDPLFFNSEKYNPLQIADLAVYCTGQFLSNSDDFAKYWDLLRQKFLSDKDGTMMGRGLTVFPSKF